jgi:hypothetical protein
MVAVAVIVHVGVAGPRPLELRHPCRSPCPKTRRRHEGEHFTRRPLLPSLRSSSCPCCPCCRWPCYPLLPLGLAACHLPLPLAMPPVLAVVVAAAVVGAVMAMLLLLTLPILQQLLSLQQPPLLRPPSPRPLKIAVCCALRAATCCVTRKT